ncbi:MAG: hypothetical protein J7647_15385 [Cyanobacteria bacterium SBLK]|nr:hypothetical protein [Cyanobacteria bacterium SBLK]
MRIFRVAIILVASVFLLTTHVNTAEANADLSGTWIGTWTSLNAPTYNGAISLYINQNGDSISGKALVGNTKCSPQRTFTGWLSGKYDNFVEFELASVDNPSQPISTMWGAITRARNAISTVYNFDTDSSQCYGDVGTMFISKVQPYSQIQDTQAK